jgi:hypothetical protein
MNSTIVTGIWDLGRDSLTEGWSRNFNHYIDNFTRLLQCKNLNLAIFIDPSLEELVWKYREAENTKVYHHKASEFNGNFFPFNDKIQEIRTSENWLSQVGWLKDSTQARMPTYNPMVMSKMFFLHNVKIFDPFDTDYFFWLDGGITNTIHPGYFSHDNVIEKIETFVNKFLFVCFPYETNTEIHGFDINKMNDFSGSKVDRVARGGFFGGHKDYIGQANDLYYGLLNESLSQNLMGTEESIFTIMTYKDPEVYSVEMINNDGLLGTFFENVKNNTTQLQLKNIVSKKTYTKKQSLYINTFNAPEQVQILINSFEKFEPKFLTKTDITLINNSTKEEYFDKYDNITKKYNLREIRNGNQGICRSRQWAAEDFNSSNNKYMFFFEDDMNIDCSDIKCSFGFNKKVENLYDTLIRIMDLENYDFLKFSFSEFYGHNGEQWSWHNVPQNLRKEYFGKINKRPPTKFNHIKSINGVVYAEGEIYYSNWPHIMSHEGNQRCFLDTKWDHPFEQTWMSHIYTLTRNQKVKTAILLASPITHDRVYHYDKSERREN